MKRAKPTGLCRYCGFRPATQMHEEFPQSKPNIAKYGSALIFHPLNCKPACERCNPSHQNVRTLNEYEFVVMMIENRVLDFIPYKVDRRAVEYIHEMESKGILQVIGDRIIYAEEVSA